MWTTFSGKTVIRIFVLDISTLYYNLISNMRNITAYNTIIIAKQELMKLNTILKRLFENVPHNGGTTERRRDCIEGYAGFQHPN